MPLPLAHQLNQLDTCFNKMTVNMTYFHTVLSSAQVLENEANEHIYLSVSAARQKNDFLFLFFYMEVVIPLHFLQP